MRAWAFAIGAAAVCGLGVIACHDSLGDAQPLALGADVLTDLGGYRQPRLHSAGTTLSSIQYDEGGHPIAISSQWARYELTWDGDVLVRAKQTNERLVHTSSFEYANGRVVRRDQNSGTDTVEYDARGSMLRWTSFNGLVRRYIYDGWGWLREIRYEREGGAHPPNQRFEYNDLGCPVSAPFDGEAYPLQLSYAEGRLDSWSRPFYTSHAAYGLDGFVTQLGDADLSYEPGEARGVDVHPALFAAISFPPTAVLFRLDGRCDPTLRSQATILTLLMTDRTGEWTE